MNCDLSRGATKKENSHFDQYQQIKSTAIRHTCELFLLGACFVLVGLGGGVDLGVVVESGVVVVVVEDVDVSLSLSVALEGGGSIQHRIIGDGQVTFSNTP